jgi:hypothetical protein
LLALFIVAVFVVLVRSLFPGRVSRSLDRVLRRIR